jgi:hypothetical protein
MSMNVRVGVSERVIAPTCFLKCQFLAELVLG